ncbi:MAG: hypothetical protein JXB43_03715 [Dehalococcoidia bacterium]|nr:hypothetical protein [Dehalococcoidia bacterium]
MWGQFLATFAVVILSFLLWFGGERIIRNQREKKARIHLHEEIVDELKENIILRGSFADLLEQELKKGRISPLGLKLNVSALSAAISSGELRLINDPEQRRLIRISADMCGEFNHIIENTELFLVVLSLKAQPMALPQAKYRLTQLKEHARRTVIYLQGVVKKLTTPQPVMNPSIKKEAISIKCQSYVTSIMVLIVLLLVTWEIQWKGIERSIVIALTIIMILVFILCIISIRYQNKRRKGLINRLINWLAALALDLRIGRLSLFLEFTALIVALIRHGYPWGLRIAMLLIIAVYVVLFWSTLRNLGKIISGRRDHITQVS